MKIAKSSWHYRLNCFNSDSFDFKFDTAYYTTCSYIRATIGTILALIVKGASILALASMVLFVFGSMLAVPVVIYLGLTPFELAGIMCVAGWFFTIMMLLYTLYTQIRNWIDNMKANVVDGQKKEPNVFIQAIIDKHNKFCTRVTAE